MSTLRIVGVLIGIICLAYVYYRLRAHSNRRVDVWMMALTGMGLIVVASFPNLLSLPSEMFYLGRLRGGRIIAILLIATLTLWILLYNVRTRLANTEDKIIRHVRRSALHDFRLRADASKLPADDAWCAVLIPAYNEADNLSHVLSEIPKSASGLDIQAIVIDDGSDDGGAALAQSYGAFVLSHSVNMGQHAALDTGQMLAIELGARYAVTMDADGQHSAADIERLLQPVTSGEADIVIGSRRLGSSAESAPAIRELGVSTISVLINVLIGTNISDCSSGFRALDLSKTRHLKMLETQYRSAEILMLAAKRGLRIKEIPIHIAERISGTSKKGREFIYALAFLRTVFTAWLR